MNRRAGSIGIMFVSAAFLASSAGSPYEDTLKTMIGSLDSISGTLKTITDEDTAMAAKPALKKANDTWVTTRDKAKKLEPPEREEKTRLEKLYKPKLEEALKKMFGEVRRVEGIPGGKDALKEIAGVLKKD